LFSRLVCGFFRLRCAGRGRAGGSSRDLLEHLDAPGAVGEHPRGGAADVFRLDAASPLPGGERLCGKDELDLGPVPRHLGAAHELRGGAHGPRWDLNGGQARPGLSKPRAQGIFPRGKASDEFRGFASKGEHAERRLGAQRGGA